MLDLLVDSNLETCNKKGSLGRDFYKGNAGCSSSVARVAAMHELHTSVLTLVMYRHLLSLCH